MTSKFARICTIFILGFVILFMCRLGYGYITQPNGEPVGQSQYYGGQSVDFQLSRKNYAGQKGGSSALPAVDQRFEKIATLGMASAKFDSDEAQIRSIATEAMALVQHEQAHGLTGQRQLQLALGVHPTRFDPVIELLRKVGKQTSFHVTKVDKTNEYRTLIAQQKSIANSKDNLIQLKSLEGADLKALVALETRILDLENQIQNLGVSVGEFDSEFEFVTIKLTLIETATARIRDLSLIQRAFTAFTWSVKFYTGLCAAFAFLMLGAALLAFTIRTVRQAIPSKDV